MNAHESLRVFRDLPPGSLIVERYTYTNPGGKSGVQWLAQRVTNEGDYELIRACKTRREALGAILGMPPEVEE